MLFFMHVSRTGVPINRRTLCAAGSSALTRDCKTQSKRHLKQKTESIRNTRHAPDKSTEKTTAGTVMENRTGGCVLIYRSF